ncbi:hypothetical protein JCM3765_007616 [Sporobolomyces pararoseus]
MHLPSFLIVATTVSSTLVSARVDRLPSAHRQFARSQLGERYRLFTKPEDSSTSPFVKRDDGASFIKIGDAVNEVATALKLEMPPVVQLSAVNTTSREKKAKSQKKKNQVCRKKTAEEKRKSKSEKEKKKKAAESKQEKTPKLNVEVKSNSHAAVAPSSSSKSSSSSSSSSDNKKSESSSSSVVNKVTGIIKPAVSLIGFHDDNCGPSGATEEYPNGSEAWLNCGLSKNKPNSGWTPPNGVTLDHLTTVTLEHALATNSEWEACKPFVPIFEKIGAEENLPPILLAAFAMQESTCDPTVRGDNNGAFGLMQITKDKCNGMDGDGCSEPWYNVRTAAQYFNSELDKRNGHFLEALGAYNGWFTGLSWATATAAAYGDCCECQQNTDYMFQMTGGWLLGRTGWKMGSNKNLAVCHK